MLKKRVLSVLLCLCMVVGMLPWITPEASAATNGHTRDEAVAEARRRAQNPYDYDGVYGPQCVDLIWWYYQYLGYRSPGGNATAYMNNQLPNNEWKRYTPDETIPQPGDIVVFKAGHKYSYKDIYGNPCYAGITGHIAIVVESNSSWYKLVEFNGTSFTTNYNYPLWDFSCVIRPDWPSSQPTAPSVNLGNDFYAYIYNAHSNCNLEARNSNVQTSSVNQFDPRQIWHFIYDSSSDSYKIVNAYDGLCLEAVNWGTSLGTNIQTYTSNNTTAQRWWVCGSRYQCYLTPIYMSNHDLVMEVTDGNNVKPAGTNIQLYTNWYREEGYGFHRAQTFQIKNADSYASPTKPTAPANIQVTNAASGTTITWNTVPTVGLYDSRAYELIIYDDTNPNSSQKIVQTTVSSNRYAYSSTLPVGDYYIMVRAINTKYPSYADNYASSYTGFSYSVAQNYAITVNATEGGTASGGGTYSDGANVTVSATASEGYEFKGWAENGSIVFTEASYTFEANVDRTLTATFEKKQAPAPITHTVSVSADPAAGGTVTGSGTYQDNESVTVTATANKGYTFKNWTEHNSEVSTSANYAFTATANRTLVAVFAKEPDVPDPPTPVTTYTISVNANPAEGGTVSGGGTYQENTSVTVRATANSGYTFKGWMQSGTEVSTDAVYTFSVAGNTSLTAVFEADTPAPTLTYRINVSATTGGTASGGGTYQSGASVTIIATPSSNYRFVEWRENGNSVSTNTTYTFSASVDRTLTAVFERTEQPPTPSYTVSVSADPAMGGSVSGGGSYRRGTSATVSASANTGYRFARWVEGGNTVSTDAAYTFTIDGNRALTAVFELEPPTPTPSYVISVDASPAEYGTVMGGGEYQEGDTITIAATPNSGYRFVEWRLDGSPISTTASYTFTASANQSYMAVFEKQEDAPPTPSAYTINVHASPAAGGTVSGGGTYQSGKAVTLTAAANTGYRFVEWQSGGTRVSTSARYTFSASANQTYTAIFEEQSETPRPVYTITVNANPAAGGSVSGGGRFEKGTSVTVVATASSSYRFAGWFENGAQVSAALSYTFTASVDRALTASFVYTGSDAGNTPGDEPNDNTHAGNSSSSNTPTAKPPLPVSTNSTSGAVTTTASPDAAITGTTAVTTITSEVAAEIIKQAVANGSEQVVIASATGADVTKAQVTLPANVLYEIERQTSADLTVSTLIADVSFHNDGLSKLSDKESVTVTVERTGTMFGLSITSGGQTVEQVRGGIVLDIPIDHGTPGSVAVLVHEDGSRQVVRKSVVNKNTITVPLSGPAVLEIVDRSKRFIDVASDSWAADAVAFASGHELFNGISPDTFGPDLPMTRGMLAMVLHNLEGNPEQATAETFSDVDASAWYAEAVAWSSARGIVSGYGNGLFGPGDNITREQLAVMLWRYAGEPAATNKELHFNDADEVSGYALDALIWAIENNIINGKGSGILDPRGQTTRAQVAQMLMNYLRK